MVLAKHPLVNLLTTHEQHKEHHFEPNRKGNSGFARMWIKGSNNELKQLKGEKLNMMKAYVEEGILSGHWKW